MSTLDFSIADISDNVIEILASSGDVYTGGSDIDKILATWIADNIKKESGVDVSGDSLAMTRVNEAAEKVKIELSSTNSTDINLPYITMNDSTPVHFVKTINRATFESLIEDEINNVIDFGKDALKKANLNASDLDGILLVGGSTRIPLVQEKLEKTFGVTLLKNADVDCIVSLGASVIGAQLGGDESASNILLLDVIPLSISIETLGGVATKMVESNTTVPVKKSQIFSTAVDNQPSISVRICQGERPMFGDNKLLGEFFLDGIAPAPRGVPQLEVTVDIDANGIMTVTAQDKATGKEQHICIESKSSLSDSDIERMKAEAKEHEEEDKKRKEEADKYNNADAMVFQIEKAMKEAGDKLTEDEKKPVEDAIGNLRNALVDKKLDDIDNLMKAVTDVWYPLATKLYQGDSGNTQNPFGGFNQGV